MTYTIYFLSPIGFLPLPDIGPVEAESEDAALLTAYIWWRTHKGRVEVQLKVIAA